MKIKRLLATAFVAISLVSTFAMSASAERLPFSFKVTLQNNQSVAYSDTNIKNDNDQYAYVMAESHNITSNDIAYFTSVAREEYGRELCSASVQVTPSNASYLTMLYKDGYAWTGAQRCLKLETLKYYIAINGDWYS